MRSLTKQKWDHWRIGKLTLRVFEYWDKCIKFTEVSVWSDKKKNEVLLTKFIVGKDLAQFYESINQLLSSTSWDQNNVVIISPEKQI